MENQKKELFENYLNVRKELDEMNERFKYIGLDLLEASLNNPEMPGCHYAKALDIMGAYMESVLGLNTEDEKNEFYGTLLDYLAEEISKDELLEMCKKYWD